MTEKETVKDAIRFVNECLLVVIKDYESRYDKNSEKESVERFLQGYGHFLTPDQQEAVLNAETFNEIRSVLKGGKDAV